MKGKLAALLVGLVLGSAGVGVAATGGFIKLGKHYGVGCVVDTGVGATMCGRTDGKGYVVGVAKDSVIVERNQKVVFMRAQPGYGG